MRRLYVLGLATALLALASPVHAGSVHERNVAYLWSMIGSHDPSQLVERHDGTTLTLTEAIEEAAARAGPRDLAALASGAVDEEMLPPWGDVWVIEFGEGSCTATILAPGPPTQPPIDPQFWIYAGAIGTLETSHGYYTQILGWTGKTNQIGFNTAGFTAIGNQDFFCFNFSGVHFAFPFIDGIAFMN